MLARDILGTAGRSNNIIAFATLSVLMYSYIFFSHFLYIAFYVLSTVIMTKTNRAKLRQVAVLGRGRGASAPLLFVQPPTSPPPVFPPTTYYPPTRRSPPPPECFR